MTLSHLIRNTMFRNLTTGVLVVGLSMGGTAWAGPRNQGSGDGYPEQGKIYQQVSPGHRTVRVGADQFIYNEGVYYRREPTGYRVVRPPKGAVVDRLPLGFETLIVAGITYLLFAGVYYRKTSSGYMVVDEPREEASPKAPATEQNGQGLTVDVAILNVRSGPSLNHPVVNQVRLGDRLEIQGTSPGWYYVRLSDGAFGWVMSKYTHPTAPAAKG